MKLTAESTVINDGKLNTDISEAKTVANNTAQYFWFTSEGEDTGAHISELPQAEFEALPSGGNLLARSSGIVIRDGMTELATFGSNEIAMGANSDNYSEARLIINKDPSVGIDYKLNARTDSLIKLNSNGFELRDDSNELRATVSLGGIRYYPFGTVAGNQFVVKKDTNNLTDLILCDAHPQQPNRAGASALNGSAVFGNAVRINNVNVECLANGVHSMAQGGGAQATGDYSSAMGYGALADATGQHAVGKFNASDSDAVFIVGIGTDSANRANGFIVKSNGNATLAGTLTQSSDRRLKDHIDYLDKDADEFIRKLKPAHYIKDDEHHVGFYAQDVEEADKWDCMTGEMNGFKTLSYTDIIAPLVAYCQHLEKRIEELERSKDE